MVNPIPVIRVPTAGVGLAAAEQQTLTARTANPLFSSQNVHFSFLDTHILSISDLYWSSIWVCMRVNLRSRAGAAAAANIPIER
jgi:hypothetical protein